MNKKYFKIIIISISIFVLLGVGFFVLNKLNQKKHSDSIDVSNWKTYQNKEVGFSIKYPDDVFELGKGSESGYLGFMKKDNKCEEAESLNDAMNCVAKNAISIEKTNKSITDYKNNLSKDKSVLFYKNKKIQLREDLTTESLFVMYKSSLIYMNEIFISSEKGNFIIGSKGFNKIRSNMASTFQFLE
jgi:hypothetical protein